MTDTTNAPSSNAPYGDAPSGATGIIGRAIRVPLFKLFLIAVLIVALIVPMTMVSGLIGERESRAMGVRSEVASEVA